MWLFSFKTLLFRISSATPTDLLRLENLCTFAVSVEMAPRIQSFY